MHPMHDINLLLYYVYITHLQYTDMYVCILYCSSMDHLKPYANH